MELLIKVAAAILIAVTLGLLISGQRKDIALLLSVLVCAMTVTAALNYLQPVISFLEKLQTIGNVDRPMFGILLKAVGIGLLAELVGLICSDAGNAALGKSLQILASVVILWLAIPLFEQLMTLLDGILGAV